MHFIQTFLKLLMHSLSRIVCSCKTKRKIFGEFWRGQTIIIFSNFCKLQAQNLKIFAKLYRLLKVGYCPSTSRVPVIPLSPVVLIPPPCFHTLVIRWTSCHARIQALLVKLPTISEKIVRIYIASVISLFSSTSAIIDAQSARFFKWWRGWQGWGIKHYIVIKLHLKMKITLNFI